MNQANNEDAKKAIERLHNCKASIIENVAVVEKFGSDTVWKGIVHVFKIEGHAKTDKCYAWSSPIEGSTSTPEQLLPPDKNGPISST
ncbi:MAG TPA: hypothetical protein VJW95_02220 [Dissulfurispiraceae bacterium]|nr:hypothetical protein [Dissulfurispiraceae bacterium]